MRSSLQEPIGRMIAKFDRKISVHKDAFNREGDLELAHIEKANASR